MDVSDECSVVYPAAKIPRVEVTATNASKDSCVKYPIVEIPGVDVESGDAKPTGVNKDFGAKPTGVELDTGAYNEAYDAAVPQEQGSEIELYGLGHQGLIKGRVFVENNINKYRIQILTSIAQQRSDKLTQVKALPTKRGGADA